MQKMADETVKHCANGIFPKLPFLLEEQEESSLKAFFNNPGENNGENDNATTSIPLLSLENRKKILETLLDKVNDGDTVMSWWRKLAPKSRAKIIVFLSENSDGLRIWSSNECSCIVEKICHAIAQSLNGNALGAEQHTENLNNYLALWFRQNEDDSLTPNDTDFRHILQLVRMKYTKSDWKYYPASAHGFGWILKQLSGRQLSDTLEMILPPALLFSDDHYDDFKVLGLQILSHIVHNVESNDLMRNNWAHVIYDAVQRHCTDKDPVVLRLMMSILMKLLTMIEKDPAKNTSQFTKYDTLFKQILFQVEFSSDLNLKRTWLPILDTYMNTLGLATLHWSDKICDILCDFTVCNDPYIWNQVLDITATLIKNTWIKADCERISEIILRIIFNVSSFHSVCLDADEKKKMIDNASHSLRLLQKCDDFSCVEKQLVEITEKGSSENLHPDFILSLKSVLPEKV